MESILTDAREVCVKDPALDKGAVVHPGTPQVAVQ